MAMRGFGLLLCLALVASACSNEAGSSTPTLELSSTTPTASAPTTTAAPTTTEAPTTTLSPEQEAEVELRELAMAYLTYEDSELETGRVEPWPQLSLTMGRLFDRLSSNRAEDLELDQYVIGTYENPVVISVEADLGAMTARVDFCSDDASRRVDADEVQIGGRWTGGPTFGYLLAVEEGDGWLLEELIFKEESCDPADYVE